MSTTQRTLVYAPRMDRDVGSYQVERVSPAGRHDQPQHYQYDDSYRNDVHRYSHDSRAERYYNDVPPPQKQPKSRRDSNENPLMTVWRETYEVWDGVLEVVGKAWFKMGGK